MYKRSDTIFANGQPLQGVAVTVFIAGSSGLATIYSDNGVTPKDNPVLTDERGFFEFYVADGRYDIRYSKSGYGTWTDTDVPMLEVTMAEVQAAVDAHNADPNAHGGVLGGGDGGGGTTEVIYTLSTMPGYGIVPDATVADYTAFDAYVAGLAPSGPSTWVEVTAGPETGITEVWRVLWNGSAYDSYGPFGAWVKNAKYILGQNDETHLIVAVEVPNWTPQGSGSSKYVAPPSASGENGAWGHAAPDRRMQNRLGQCVPVFADPLTFPADGRIRVTGNRAGRHDFTLVLNVSGEGVYTNRVSELLVDSEFSGALAIGGNKQGSAEFYLHEGAVWFDCERTTNVAGLPWAYATTQTDGAQKYQPMMVGSSGVVVWDHFNPQSQPAISEGGGAYRVLFSDEHPGATITIAGPTTMILQSINPSFGAYLLYLTNGGSDTITWPVNTAFEGGVEPAWTVAGTDLVGCLYNGSTWTIVLIAADVKVPA
jgi:hypothetical protein